MCGIAGIVTLHPPFRPEILHSMGEALGFRGPDEFRVETDPAGLVGLVHRRLRIIDLSTRASQPMTTPDGVLTIVYNGEIYNFQEERELLRQRGVQFASQSDTEVLLRLYEAYGVGCLQRLNGMFAFVIHDRRRRTLFVARDRAGVKPLVYTLAPTCFRFSSEIKALLCDPDVARDVDGAALLEYFTFGYIPAPLTIFKAIRKLEPAHYLVIDYSGSELRATNVRYWSLPTDERPIGPAQAREELRALLEDATRRRLIADVPVGAFLSGGIDSTLITGLMSRTASEPVRTFTVGYEDAPFYDERKYARLAAGQFGTRHTEIVLRTADLFAAISEMVPYLDEPFGDSSVIPAFVTCRALRQHVTVALSGDGGDELFAGYNKYKAERVFRRAALLMPLLRALSTLLPGGESSGIQNRLRLFRKFVQRHDSDFFVRNYNLAAISSLVDLRELFTKPELQQYVDSGMRQLEGVYAPTRNFRDQLNRVLYADYCFTLPYDMLAKMDYASMRSSLENRSPFLDYRVAELIIRVDSHEKATLSQSKRILRSAFADLIPPVIARRPKKGFEMPISAWLRKEMREEVRTSLEALPSMFERAKVNSILEEQKVDSLRTPLLWSLYVYSQWTRFYQGLGVRG